jgi:hypothetical protein
MQNRDVQVQKYKEIARVNKGGRPVIPINEPLLEELAAMDLSTTEIEAELGIDFDTVYTRYPHVLKRGRARGNASLKRMMFQKAMQGDIGMLVWLSKNRFGYRDKPIEDAQQVNFNVFINEIPK